MPSASIAWACVIPERLKNRGVCAPRDEFTPVGGLFQAFVHLARNIQVEEENLEFVREYGTVVKPHYCPVVEFTGGISPRHEYRMLRRFKNRRCSSFKPTSMNHLFVRVKLCNGSRWLYIEPQADYDGYNYKMEDYWGIKYDSRFNKYGETVYWLGECRR